ncbi:MAG TPA: beta-L-arabinofuranosidase domain-containing protein, partial [Acidimicrobiales bacterium]|nr:beta-L-arabinofuranosidase domain-containing protein [Acidimicrobiales bacterium]
MDAADSFGGAMTAASSGPLSVRLTDAFWAPRQAQLRHHTLPVLLERLEAHGVVDNFRRLSGRSSAPRKGLWFTDSDLYKWMEAAAWADRHDLLDPVIEVVAAAVRPDGYLHTFYDSGAGSPPRYGDLANSHEWYCGGHLIEAALAHHEVTGSDALLGPARRWADHLCATFGPHGDARVDGHPEVEVALARLARNTGEERYLAQAIWVIETQLAQAELTLDSVELAGHAVKALYLASAIAEVAMLSERPHYEDAARRLFASLIAEHSYPTGAVGGRWLDESVGKPYELPDAMAYAESCAAVAATHFCHRIWQLTGDPRSLDQTELLLYNAVPCGTGADGESWFYSQPHAVAEVTPESNPWVQPLEYQQSMLLEWFPVRRHGWFEVTCCPTNLARMFATVHHHVAELTAE